MKQAERRKNADAHYAKRMLAADAAGKKKKEKS